MTAEAYGVFLMREAEPLRQARDSFEEAVRVSEDHFRLYHAGPGQDLEFELCAAPGGNGTRIGFVVVRDRADGRRVVGCYKVAPLPRPDAAEPG